MSDDGTYEPVCGRTGEWPVPANGFRFEGHEATEITVCAARKHRSAFQRCGPDVPYYNLIASEHDSRSGSGDATATVEGWTTAGATSGLPEPPYDLGTDAGGRTECATDGDHSEQVEFCHRVVAAVFKALMGANHRAVETAVVDAYSNLTETMSSANNLCLRPLESMATAFHVHLASTEQADVLERAVSNLTLRPGVTRTLMATLVEMERPDLVGSYTCSAWRFGSDMTTRAAELALKDYALLMREGRLPALPVVLRLYRQTSSWRPVSLRVTSTESG